MCSQAMVNARQTPILASPSTNIAGSQTNRFITASYVPLGRMRPGKRLLREMEDRRRGASISLRSPQGAAGWRQPPRSTVPSLSRYIPRRSASSKRRKLAILIWLVERKDPIRTQATAHPPQWTQTSTPSHQNWIGTARGLEGALTSGRGGGSPRSERFVS
jgi:transposase